MVRVMVKVTNAACACWCTRIASWAAKGSIARVWSCGSASFAAAAAATAARVTRTVTGVGAVATVPGSVGVMAAAPLAAVNSVDLIVR